MTEQVRERLRFVVPPKQSKERLDLYLTRQVENATRTKVRNAIKDGYVTVNGEKIKPSHLIAPGEIIDVVIPGQPKPDVLPEPIPLDIVYEDEGLIVVNKPAGMVVHPAYTHYSGTLVNALLHHTQSLSSVNTHFRPGIVHRLDKDTSGLLVVAKNDVVHHKLAKQFSQHSIEREYRALVWGSFRSDSGIIEAALGRSSTDRKKFAVTAGGKHAVTEYRVLERFGFVTYVALRLRTGRTHQIRVHLSHIGHPVFGDPTYGGRSASWGGTRGKSRELAQQLLSLIRRQALHARSLGFIHPRTLRPALFSSDLPSDMAEALDILKRHSSDE